MHEGSFQGTCQSGRLAIDKKKSFVDRSILIMFRKLKLQMKLFSMVITIVTLVLSMTIGFVSVKLADIAKAGAFQEVERIAANNGNLVRADLQYALDTARALAQVFENYKTLPSDQRRANHSQYLKSILEKPPAFLVSGPAGNPTH